MMRVAWRDDCPLVASELALEFDVELGRSVVPSWKSLKLWR
jgi:hypothetical protein